MKFLWLIHKWFSALWNFQGDQNCQVILKVIDLSLATHSCSNFSKNKALCSRKSILLWLLFYLQYIRLCPDDSVDDCFDLMNQFWHIMEPEPPHLVISVVGGAKNFKLDGRLRDTFSTGLIKVLFFPSLLCPLLWYDVCIYHILIFKDISNEFAYSVNSLTILHVHRFFSLQFGILASNEKTKKIFITKRKLFKVILSFIED